jgi:hypothetical protein
MAACHARRSGTGLSATSPSTRKPNTLRAFRFYPLPLPSLNSLVVPWLAAVAQLKVSTESFVNLL